MSTITVYDTETGEIEGTFKRSHGEWDFDVLLEPGQSWVSGEVDAEKYLIVDGVPVDRPPPSEEEEIAEAWVRLRGRRDLLLGKTDWTQVPDAPVDQAAWATYRQALRDLPEQTEDPRDVVWPEPPAPI